MERRSPYFASFSLGFFPGQLELEQCFHNWNICRHRCILCHQLNMDTFCHDLWLACASPAPLLFHPTQHLQPLLSLQLHRKWMYFCNCNIYTSGYKSGSLCGTGIYHWLIFLVFTASASCLFCLFITVIFTWNFWNKETMSKLIQRFSTRFQQFKIISIITNPCRIRHYFFAM